MCFTVAVQISQPSDWLWDCVLSVLLRTLMGMQETRGAASASPPPLSMTQQALVGAGLVAFGGLLAATATVIVGAAAVKMLPIPRPRFPSFALW